VALGNLARTAGVLVEDHHVTLLGCLLDRRG